MVAQTDRIGGGAERGAVAAGLDLDSICRDVASMVMKMRSNAIGCHIVIEIPDGTGGVTSDRIAVPLFARSGDELGQRILTVLGRLRTGEWMKGQSIANELDEDRNAGNFRRALQKLVHDGMIESDNPKGYRLKRPE
jgi:hypothetical protein